MQTFDNIMTKRDYWKYVSNNLPFWQSKAIEREFKNNFNLRFEMACALYPNVTIDEKAKLIHYWANLGINTLIK